MRTLRKPQAPRASRAPSEIQTVVLRCARLLACVGLLAAGCRADNHSVLLERDLRLQEDRIYQLQACLEDAQAARESTLRENEALKRELAGGDRGPGPADRPSSSERSAPDLKAPTVELPGETAPVPGSRKRDERPDLRPPTIELPESSEVPPVEVTPGGSQTMVDSPPTQLVINKRLTGGLDRDGHDGDEGILVVFEPRDAAGHLVKWPGKVSIVVMDPALEGEAARVARWDFGAQEVPSHFLNTVLGRGLQFELPWPSTPPKNRELQVFVRFTTDDGRKLTSDTKIDVRPPGDLPGVDRQTKRRSAAGGDESARKPAPRSRIKGRSSSRDVPRASRSPAATDSADASSADLDTGDETDIDAAGDQRDDGRDDPPSTARRNAPLWKPYR